MKVILFGATGMVGQGVLRECLRDDGVEGVLAVGRRATGRLSCSQVLGPSGPKYWFRPRPSIPLACDGGGAIIPRWPKPL
jgi:uncharacterized protein YbjT (DUF2867 family)